MDVGLDWPEEKSQSCENDLQELRESLDQSYFSREAQCSLKLPNSCRVGVGENPWRWWVRREVIKRGFGGTRMPDTWGVLHTFPPRGYAFMS